MISARPVVRVHIPARTGGREKDHFGPRYSRCLAYCVLHISSPEDPFETGKGQGFGIAVQPAQLNAGGGGQHGAGVPGKAQRAVKIPPARLGGEQLQRFTQEHRRMRWKNGLGWTNEPAAAGELGD